MKIPICQIGESGTVEKRGEANASPAHCSHRKSGGRGILASLALLVYNELADMLGLYALGVVDALLIAEGSCLQDIVVQSGRRESNPHNQLGRLGLYH